MMVEMFKNFPFFRGIFHNVSYFLKVRSYSLMSIDGNAPLPVLKPDLHLLLCNVQQSKKIFFLNKKSFKCTLHSQKKDTLLYLA